MAEGTGLYAKPNALVEGFDSEEFNGNPTKEDVLSLIKSDSYLTAMCRVMNFIIRVKMLKQMKSFIKNESVYVQESEISLLR